MPSAIIENMSPALVAFKLVDAALKGVADAFGIGLSRGRLADEVAEVEEVLVVGGALGEL
jgi:hypothetical protein